MTLHKFRYVSAAFLAALALSGRAGTAEFTLVRNGRPDVRIVYTNAAARGGPATAAEAKRFRESLDDFRDILQRISGAEIPAVPAGDAGGDDPAGTIQIGLTTAARAAGLDKVAATLAPHALLIRSDPGRKILYLLGTTPEGNGHALYEFLESLGCRWYMPGPLGERLPVMKTITAGPMDVVRDPEFELRSIQLRAAGSAAGGTRTREEFMVWMRRSKFGGSGPDRGHQFAKLVPVARYEKEHPEYYSLRDGKRRTSHLCMSSPGTMDAAEAFLTEHFTKHPEATGFPVALADGAQFCECPACTKACGGTARNIMPLYLKFTGELFDRIDKKFPGRPFQYGFYVYSNLMDVPEGRIPKQLAPYIAPLGYDAFHTTADPQRYLALSVAKDFPAETIARIKADPRSEAARFVHRVILGWSDGTDNIYLRDYDPYITFAQNMPLLRTYQLAIEIPWHKEIGVRGYTPEATANAWFTSGINFWVRSRFYWDTKQDIKAVMEDYCQGMFGAAWEPMYLFLDRLARRTIESPAFRHGDQVLTSLYDAAWVQDLDFLLRQAESLAGTEADKARVNMWRLCQQHMLKYLQTREAERTGDFVNAASLGRDYLQFLDYISTVNPHFVDNRWYAEREYSMQTLVPQYERLAARLNGEEGRLILALPTHWWFRHDPDDGGLQQGWARFDPVADYVPPEGNAVTAVYPPMPGWRQQATEASWQTVSNDYRGYNWFRTQVKLPEALQGRKVSMLATGIFGHMDFFINGERVAWSAVVRGPEAAQAATVNHLDLGEAWSWNYNETFDIPVDKYLKAGAINTFAVRTRDKYKWGGIFKRIQFYEPFVEPSPPAQPAVRCDCSR